MRKVRNIVGSSDWMDVRGLNLRATRLCRRLESDGSDLGIRSLDLSNGTRCWDFGVTTPGSLRAGRYLARICMADLGEIAFQFAGQGATRGPLVTVATDQPVAACLASQYAGWKISQEDYFAMGSGPMRAAAAVEPLFVQLLPQANPSETTTAAVGVLESSQLPTEAVADEIAGRCGVAARDLQLCVARTASLAGHVQIVARSVETALHKLLDLRFDLSQIISGFGAAPLPPVAADDLVGIGRTNDAILYGAEVILWVRSDDDQLADVAPQVPSCASPDYGSPFSTIFARYDQDFYKIDPHLFSPAAIELVNLNTGRRFRAGETRPDILLQSFDT